MGEQALKKRDVEDIRAFVHPAYLEPLERKKPAQKRQEKKELPSMGEPIEAKKRTKKPLKKGAMKPIALVGLIAVFSSVSASLFTAMYLKSEFTSSYVQLYSDLNVARGKTSDGVRREEFEEKIKGISEILKFLLSKVGEEQFKQNETKATEPKHDLYKIASIKTPRANLRKLPDLNSEVVMSVASGTKLLVEAEKGDFFQVTAPDGTASFIAKAVVNLEDIPS